MTTPIETVIGKVLRVYKSWRADTSPEQKRHDWDELFGADFDETKVKREVLNGVEAAWIGDTSLPCDRVFVYLHGGGYQVGSVRSHYELISRLSQESQCLGLCVSYRCAPEHRFPAPIDDCENVYLSLLERGIAPHRIALIGDSAGGNLAIATTLRLAEKGVPVPAAIGLLSPWTDLQALGESYQTRAEADPIHQRKMILHMAGEYLDGAEASQPLASPINANLENFPPTFIQVGDRETVLDDARGFAARLKEYGREVTCQVWDEMIHVFQQFPEELVQAQQASQDMGQFINQSLFKEDKG